MDAPKFTNPIPPDLESGCDLNGLLPLIQRLDRLLSQAISALQQTEEELGVSGFPQIAIASEPAEITIPSDSPLAWLQQTFRLSSFDLDILAIALAPELYRRYERIYAYLQDDMSGQKPTVDFALNLLCSSLCEKLSQRQHFTTQAPLINHHLLHLSPESERSHPTLLSQSLCLDSQVVRLLSAQTQLIVYFAKKG